MEKNLILIDRLDSLLEFALKCEHSFDRKATLTEIDSIEFRLKASYSDGYLREKIVGATKNLRKLLANKKNDGHPRSNYYSWGLTDLRSLKSNLDANGVPKCL
jgi:hypothetical protein